MKAGICNHYNREVRRRGQCDQGINVRESVGGDDFGWLKRTPCLQSNNSEIICEYYSEPTQQEIDDFNKSIDDYFEKFKKALPLIEKLKEENKEGWNGIVECPECGGKLHYSVSSLNGHVHGRCETDDCLSWME